MKLQLDTLAPDPLNARRLPPSQDAMEAMADSLASIGQLQPIVVRARDDGEPGWFVTIGATRLAAARSIGWTEIDAETLAADIDATAASAAENMVRRAMHPVDQWRAVATIMADERCELDRAAAFLGLDPHRTKLMGWLAAMAPPILDALAEDPVLPPNNILRLIALAPLDVQARAIGGKRHNGQGIDWHTVAQACAIQQRISAIHAIFDWRESGIHFDEDLFAQPGSADQFTTTDVRKFIAAQSAALKAKAEASNGRIIIGTVDPGRSIKPPDGYDLTWDQVPKRWKKADPRKVVMAFATDGWDAGRIVERVAVAKPPSKAANGAAAHEPEPKQRPPREPVTKAVRATLAAMMGEATRKALDQVAVEWAEADNWPDLIRLLLLAIAADNLRIETQQSYAHNPLPQRLISALINPGGDIKHLPLDQIGKLVADAVGSIIAFDQPMSTFGTSGPVAQWIGGMVRADEHMDRCDTEDILKGFSGDLLATIAEANGIDASGKVGELRKRMIGHMPDWRPVTFEARLNDREDDGDDDGEADIEPDHHHAQPRPREELVA